MVPPLGTTYHSPSGRVLTPWLTLGPRYEAVWGREGHLVQASRALNSHLSASACQCLMHPLFRSVVTDCPVLEIAC